MVSCITLKNLQYMIDIYHLIEIKETLSVYFESVFIRNKNANSFITTITVHEKYTFRGQIL